MALDSVTIFAGASFLLVLAGVVQHFWDRYAPNGFYKRNVRIATENATAIRTAVEGLRSSFEESDVSESLPDFATLQATFTELPNKIQTSVAQGIVQASRDVM